MRKMSYSILILTMLIPMVYCSCKPSFEQQRAVVVDYLQAYNKIDNDLDETLDSIISSLPFDTRLPQVLTAYQGALQRNSELEIPSEETAEHYQAYIQFLEHNITAIQDLQVAISSKNQTTITNAYNELDVAQRQASPMNRVTESLMVKYNITDSEVNYRFRGK